MISLSLFIQYHCWRS